MCIRDGITGENVDKCQTLRQLQLDLDFGNELVKCGECLVDYYPYPLTNDINKCSGTGLDAEAVPCGADEETGEIKYPMCIRDSNKNKAKSRCATISKMEQKLAKKIEKGKGGLSVSCGFCDEINYFEGGN